MSKIDCKKCTCYNCDFIGKCHCRLKDDLSKNRHKEVKKCSNYQEVK